MWYVYYYSCDRKLYQKKKIHICATFKLCMEMNGYSECNGNGETWDIAH